MNAPQTPPQKNADTITITYLQMTHPDELIPTKHPDKKLELQRAGVPSAALNQWLYRTVGAPYQWTDRLGWSDEAWAAYVRQETLETWLGVVSGTPVGFFELSKQGTDTEIAIFGLLPEFVGKGLGGTFLTLAIRCAWQSGAERVWLHTCSLDHPLALKNYVARGFKPFKQEHKPLVKPAL